MKTKQTKYLKANENQSWIITSVMYTMHRAYVQQPGILGSYCIQHIYITVTNYISLSIYCCATYVLYSTSTLVSLSRRYCFDARPTCDSAQFNLFPITLTTHIIT